MLFWSASFALLAALLFTQQHPATPADHLQHGHLTDYLNNNIDYSDDTGVAKIVKALQSNIIQWSFIESQLLEPNININMPEIVIPLRHLSQALNILGNILYSRDDIYESKIIFERACPLVELVPSNVDEKAADACFLKLKDVYKRIYEGESVDEIAKSNKGIIENDNLSRRDRRSRKKQNIDENNGDERNNRTNDTSPSLHIRQGQIYDLLKEINVYDTLGSENQNKYNADELFNADYRINELRSPYDHIRAELSRDSLSREETIPPENLPVVTEIVKRSTEQLFKLPKPQLTDAHLNMEPYYDIPSIQRYANYDREQSKLMFYNIISMISNFVSADSVGKNMLLVNVLNTYITPRRSNEAAHAIYKSVAEIMSNVIKDDSFEACLKVLSDFFDLTGLNKSTFVRGLNEIEARGMPISAETQWRLLVIYIFDKAFDDIGQASDSTATRSDGSDDNKHKGTNKYINENFGNKQVKKVSTKGAANFDFEKFADDPVHDAETVVASTTDSLTYLSYFFLIIILLIIYGIYQESQRKRSSNTRSSRYRKSSSRSNNNDIVAAIYSVLDILSNKHRNNSSDDENSDTDTSRLGAVDIHNSIFARLSNAWVFLLSLWQRESPPPTATTAGGSTSNTTLQNSSKRNKAKKSSNKATATASRSNTSKVKEIEKKSEPLSANIIPTSSLDEESDDVDANNFDSESENENEVVDTGTSSVHAVFKPSVTFAGIDDGDSAWNNVNKQKHKPAAIPAPVDTKGLTVPLKPILVNKKEGINNEAPRRTKNVVIFTHDQNKKTENEQGDAARAVSPDDCLFNENHSSIMQSAVQPINDQFDTRGLSIPFMGNYFPRGSVPPSNGGYFDGENSSQSYFDMYNSNSIGPLASSNYVLHDDDDSLLRSIQSHVSSSILGPPPGLGLPSRIGPPSGQGPPPGVTRDNRSNLGSFNDNMFPAGNYSNWNSPGGGLFDGLFSNATPVSQQQPIHNVDSLFGTTMGYDLSADAPEFTPTSMDMMKQPLTNIAIPFSIKILITLNCTFLHDASCIKKVTLVRTSNLLVTNIPAIILEQSKFIPSKWMASVDVPFNIENFDYKYYVQDKDNNVFEECRVTRSVPLRNSTSTIMQVEETFTAPRLISN